MPLDKSGSKAAFSNNVRAEMDAGRPQKQALAIAFSVKRRKRARGGMAAGGDPLSTDDFDQAPLKSWPGSDSPYVSEGAAAADAAAAVKLRRPDLPGIAYGSRPEVRAARDAGLTGIASMAGILPAAAIAGANFAAQHESDPHWGQHLAESAIPAIAGVAGGPLLGKAISAAPLLTAAGLGLGAAGLSSEAGEASDEKPWEGTGYTKQEWHDLDDTREGIKTKANLLSARQAKKDAADAARSSADAFIKSMPPRDKLDRLGVTPEAWQTIATDPSPQNRRGELLHALTGMAADDRQKELEAAMPWREKHQEISSAIPWLSSLAWGAPTYVARARAQAAANDFNRSAAGNVALGKYAIHGDPVEGVDPDLLAGRAAVERARSDLRLAKDRGVAASIPHSLLAPSASGALLSTIPEDIDMGQKAGTPNQDASIGRFFSLPTLGRAGLAGAASLVGQEAARVAPIQRAAPFPAESVKPFIKTYGKFYKDLDKGQGSRPAPEVVGRLAPEALGPSSAMPSPSELPTIPPMLRRPSRKTSAVVPEPPLLPGWSDVPERASGGALPNLPDMHDGTTAHLHNMQDIGMNHPQHYADGGSSDEDVTRAMLKAPLVDEGDQRNYRWNDFRRPDPKGARTPHYTDPEDIARNQEVNGGPPHDSHANILHHQSQLVDPSGIGNALVPPNNWRDLKPDWYNPESLPPTGAAGVGIADPRQGLATGGISEPQMPWFARKEIGAGGGGVHSGPIMGTGPGRVDHRNMSVASGSYVVPAETLSHLGQSNSVAGMKIAHSMFNPVSGPYGSSAMAMRHASGLPRPPAAPKFADGGNSDGGGRGDSHSGGVPIVAADGEYVITPEVVKNIGGGDVGKGHKILDAWILSTRKKHIAAIKALKPPAKS